MLNHLPVKAILFDFDGVIVDSMTCHARAWHHIFSEAGVPMQPDELLLQEGRPIFDIVRLFLDRIGEADNLQLQQDLMRRKQAYFFKHFRPSVYPEMQRLVPGLRSRDLQLAIVTGSKQENVRKFITPEFRAHFEAVVTADDIVRGKPHPEPYLKAAGMLGVAGEQCLVVENAPLGIESARAAGMRVVAIASTLAEAHLKRADTVVSHFDQLAPAISNLTGIAQLIDMN